MPGLGQTGRFSSPVPSPTAPRIQSGVAFGPDGKPVHVQLIQRPFGRYQVRRPHRQVVLGTYVTLPGSPSAQPIWFSFDNAGGYLYIGTYNALDRYSPASGLQTIATANEAAGVSPVLVPPVHYVATSNDPNLSAVIFGDKLILTAGPTAAGVSQVTVTASDGVGLAVPSGRSATQTFDVLIANASITPAATLYQALVQPAPAAGRTEPREQCERAVGHCLDPRERPGSEAQSRRHGQRLDDHRRRQRLPGRRGHRCERRLRRHLGRVGRTDLLPAIRERRHGALGATTQVNGLVYLSTSTHPRVAMDANGGFMVVWMARDGRGDDHDGLLLSPPVRCQRQPADLRRGLLQARRPRRACRGSVDASPCGPPGRPSRS